MKEKGSTYELAINFHNRKCDEAWERSKNAEDPYDKVVALEDFEIESLRLRHLRRRRRWKLIH